MTKEEYERLLKSDYWKGYSYSLIKERNFTCEDCGRSFPNERNKLQVHHLVYRDINPWSYKPEEVVVLCKECHQKRHGIIPITEPINVSKKPETDNYTRSYSSNYNTSEKDVRQEAPQKEPDYYPRRRRSISKYVVLSCLIAAILSFIIPHEKSIESNESSPGPSKQVVISNKEKTKKTSPAIDKQPAKVTKRESVQKVTIHNDVSTNKSTEQPVKSDDDEPEVIITSRIQSSSVDSSDHQSTSVIVGGILDEAVTGKDDEVDVSQEASTSETQDRIIHAGVVKRAKEVGVSTEGTTSEIQDRIIHAGVVKRAKEIGVSTEGTTSEIQDRIIHAGVVKRAKEIGVSTEGTTSEIQDRIIHAGVVKRAKEVGVSNESTKSETQKNKE